jgi:hypothetical protein
MDGGDGPLPSSGKNPKTLQLQKTAQRDDSHLQGLLGLPRFLIATEKSARLVCAWPEGG